MQTVGTFSSAHTAPPAAIQNYLGTPAAQAAIPASAFVPQSTQYTQLQLYNQLENLGECMDIIFLDVLLNYVCSAPCMYMHSDPNDNIDCNLLLFMLD